MKIHLLAVGEKMPDWVQAGYTEYVRRLPSHLALHLKEIPAGDRRGRTAAQAMASEGERLLAALPRGCLTIALDERGKGWSTRDLARRLDEWQTEGRDVALLVGGPDGLSGACLERADLRWSLSPLTLPHALVRVVLAEQIYRAWTLLQGHPYHR